MADGKCSPPFGKNLFTIPAGVKHGEHTQFIRLHHIKNSVRKTVKVHAADVGEADGIEQRALAKFSIDAEKFLAELAAQSGKLILIPIVGVLQVSPDERMSFERGHLRIP